MFSLILPFIDQSEAFTIGFEAGQIYAICESGKSIKDYLMHTKNKDQIISILKRFGYYRYNFVYHCEDWSYLTAEQTSIN